MPSIIDINITKRMKTNESIPMKTMNIKQQKILTVSA